ncbi:MAG: collagen-binding domain-containing protein [Leifsonia sp.]
MGGRLRRIAALVGVSAVIAMTAAIAGVVSPALADVGPVNPVRVPLDGHPANSGFLVFVEGNAFLNADESEGTIAVGGDLAFGTAYNVAAGAAPSQPTFTAPGDLRPTYLYVGGGMDFSQSDGGDILRVQNQGFTKVADPTTYSAFDRDQNNTLISYRVTPFGATAETIPRIEGTITQTPASIATPVPTTLIDIPSAFDVYRGLSTDLGTCPTTVVLTDDAGNPLASPFAQGARGHVRLTPNQTNVLTIAAADLARLGELTFDDQPSPSAPLLVNVTGASFTGSMPNSPGISSAHAPFILYNFAEATAITVTGGASLEGTLYAPRADLQWTVTQNIEGNVIAASFTHGIPVLPTGIPREVHDFPFAAQLSCVTAPPPAAELTLVKVVDGGPAAPGDWDLTADGPTPITGSSGDTTVMGAVVDPGDYTLSESTGPGGYTAGDWTCVGATVVDDVVTLEPGDAATCTIVNTYTAGDPKLTLVKVVKGGTAPPTSWVLSANGTTPIAGVTGSVAVTVAEVLPGDYTLSESGGPAGYSASTWVCTGGAAPAPGSSATIAIDWGDVVVCTITNTFVSPTLPATGVDGRGPVAAAMLLIGSGIGLISFRMVRTGRRRA